MTQLNIQGSVYLLAEETDLDALKDELLSAMRGEPTFVTFVTMTGETVTTSVTSCTPLALIESVSHVHYPEMLPDDDPRPHPYSEFG
ncbi:hypothetical protein NB037_03010 [Rathayibacter sp. ZW T2_19]|uniref:Uncharacterized protein n=1 Tax=Rathayibacter rubneri TaxID=2950106 RepID=A0A9X2DV85_9MICO|nr:hypothetical protein [Rathayibacter rubneri]MCM6761377.1 hypothetical protein [Rathayibacter rubneri]